MPCHDFSGKIFSKIAIMLRPPPLPCSSCMLRYAEWPEQPEPWLTTQRQTENSIYSWQRTGIYFLTCLQLVGTWVKNIFRNLVPDFLTCPELVGTWVKNLFRNLIPVFWRVMFQMLRFVACQYLSWQLVLCHVVSQSCVSACPCHVVATLTL